MKPNTPTGAEARVAWLRNQLHRRRLHRWTRPWQRPPTAAQQVRTPFKQGHAAGFDEGYTEGAEAGFGEGYRQGRADGYAHGYADGLAAGESRAAS